MYVFIARAYFCASCVSCTWSPHKALRCSVTRVTDGCEPSCGNWKSKLGPLENQPMFLTAGHFSSPKNMLNGRSFGISYMWQFSLEMKNKMFLFNYLTIFVRIILETGLYYVAYPCPDSTVFLSSLPKLRIVSMCYQT